MKNNRPIKMKLATDVYNKNQRTFFNGHAPRDADVWENEDKS
jgi:hypothetical protein